ncbi:hypothetical protein [Virgibacillus halophilus]|uniref:hypothetical protein n=1 Tax=Tigheibacillus halophilus TaxID=361280 RepID=UPI0036F1B9BD
MGILHLKKLSVTLMYPLFAGSKRESLLIEPEDKDEIDTYSFLVDNTPISNEEMNQAIAFIRTKRL